jgi:hypothetical protein
MDEDTAELEEVDFGDALAELHPFIGREYVVLLWDRVSGSSIMTAAGHLNSVQGDDDFAMILLGPDNDLRIELKREQVRKVRCTRGAGSLVYDFDGVRVALSLEC